MAAAKSFRELNVFLAARTGAAAMLSRMIDRADDFCKHSPAADYRAIPEARPGPITDL
jgi:hypothetical protein